VLPPRFDAGAGGRALPLPALVRVGGGADGRALLLLARDGIVSGGVPRDGTGLTVAFLCASLSEGDRLMVPAILRLRA
jgi:hypothetical protein